MGRTVQELNLQSKTSSVSEYLIFRSHNIRFVYIKIKGHWACGTLCQTFVLVVYCQNGTFSLYPLERGLVYRVLSAHLLSN